MQLYTMVLRSLASVGAFSPRWLIQSANSSVGIKSLQDVCVCVHCGIFCATGFSCVLFFGTRVTHHPRKKELHTKISHSHRLAAEDGQKSASIQRRVKSVDLKKKKCVKA